MRERAQKLVSAASAIAGAGVTLSAITPEITDGRLRYKFVEVVLDKKARTAMLTMSGPSENAPKDVAAARSLGAELWHLRAFRELDDALLRLRFNHEDIGLVLVRSRGDANKILAHDQFLCENESDRFLHEVQLKVSRVLRRLDITAKSLFAVMDPESAFSG